MHFVELKIRPNLLCMAGVCATYLASAELAQDHAVVGQTVTMLWPPSGIALAAVLIGGNRVWPGIALGALLANADTGVPMLTLFLIVLGNTLEPVYGVALLRLQSHFSMTLETVSDVLALVSFAAVISTMMSASLGTLGLFAGGVIAPADAGSSWLAWWLGDGMGILVISPVLLTVVGAVRAIPDLFSFQNMAEALTLIVAVTAIGQVNIGSPNLAGLG